MNLTNGTYTGMRPLDYGLVGLLSFLFGAAFVLLALMIILRNFNPLKSRGFVAPLGVVLYLFLVLRLFLQFLGPMNPDDVHGVTYNFSCYWFTHAPIMTVYLYMQLLSMIRYIMMNDLAALTEEAWKIQNKQNVAKIEPTEKDKQIYLRLESKVRFGKFMLSPIFGIALVVLIVLFWITCEILIVVIGGAAIQDSCIMGGQRSKPTTDTMMGVNLGIFGLTCIISMIFFLIDIILFIRKHRCEIIRYFRDDSLFYRSEYIFMLIWMVLGLSATSYSFYTSTSVGPLILGGLVIVQGFGFFAIGGNLVFLTLISQCRKVVKTIDPTSIHDVLSDKEGRNNFFRYAQTEWSQENILSFEDLVELRGVRSSLRRERGRQIVDTYFKNGAVIEVNIPTSIRNDLGKIGTQDLKEEEFVEIITATEKEILSNLKDTFFRFTGTNEYITWQKSLTDVKQ